MMNMLQNQSQSNTQEPRSRALRSLLRAEMFIKYTSQIFVLLAIYFGSQNLSYHACLTILIVCSCYQVLRLYGYSLGSFLWAQHLPGAGVQWSGDQPLPLISVIVPCFNEEKVILNCLKSLEKLNYPHFDVIVIDDGSTDKSFEVVQDYIPSSPLSVRVFKQTNSGKSEALNFAFRQSQADYVLCIDADCELSANSLLAGLRHFQQDPQVAAVAGAVRVANRESLLTEYQELEYGLGDLQKASLSLVGMVNVVPGPVGLFKKSFVQSVGGYDTESGVFAEDTELTLKLIAEGYKVTFEPEMSSFTEVPETMTSLMRQRYRWTRGVYQALRKNISSLGETHPIFTAYLILEKIWTPIIDFSVLVFFAVQFIVNAQFEIFFSYSTMIIITEMLQLLLVIYLSNRRYRAFSLLVMVVSRFSLSVIVTAWKYLSLLEEWGQVEMSWDKLQRVGNSKYVEDAVC